MKKLLTIAAFSLPMAITPAVFAQTTPSAAGSGAGGTTAPANTAPAPSSPAPSAPSSNGSASGNAAGASTTPATPGTGAASSGSAAMTEAITGWSVKDKIMGKAVVNENDEKIGDISDVVLASDGKAAYFIVGAGGFLGMGEHKVAIPFQDIKQTDDKLVLQGYTKDQLKALPEVKVAK